MLCYNCECAVEGVAHSGFLLYIEITMCIILQINEMYQPCQQFSANWKESDKTKYTPF